MVITERFLRRLTRVVEGPIVGRRRTQDVAQIRSARDIKLAIDAGQVLLDGADSDAEALCDIFVALAFRRKLGHSTLSGAEFLQAVSLTDEPCDIGGFVGSVIGKSLPQRLGAASVGEVLSLPDPCTGSLMVANEFRGAAQIAKDGS